MNWIKRRWRLFKASARIDLEAVCEMSKGMGMVDYHDYPDSDPPEPWHFHTHKCRRCGKEFTI